MLFEIDRPGLGRQRGLARRRRRRDLRGVPGLVRDDVLGLLPRAAADPRPADRAGRLVRVARARATSPRWRATWLAANTIAAASARRSCGASRSRACCTASRSTRAATSPAASSTSSASTPSLAGVAVVALFAFHGATFLTLRTTGDALRAGRRRRPAARDPGASRCGARLRRLRRSTSPSTANDKDVFPPILPAVLGGRRARRSPSCSCARRAAAAAFAMTAARDDAARRDALHEPLPARDGLAAPTSRTASRSTSAASSHYALTGDHRRRADRHAGRPPLPGLDATHVFRGAAGDDAGDAEAPSGRRAAGAG